MSWLSGVQHVYSVFFCGHIQNHHSGSPSSHQQAAAFRLEKPDIRLLMKDVTWGKLVTAYRLTKKGEGSWGRFAAAPALDRISPEVYKDTIKLLCSYSKQTMYKAAEDQDWHRSVTKSCAQPNFFLFVSILSWTQCHSNVVKPPWSG